MATYDLKYPGAAIDAILDTAYDLQNAGYIFRGLASEYSNTPTERSWVLAGEGETGHGFTSPVPKGYIGVCVFDGTSWTGKLLKCVSIDSTPTNGSTNAVSSGGAYASINNLATFIDEALDNLTFTDTTPSAFLGDYIKMKVSTTDGGIERIMTYFTILAATAEKAGLLSAADKQKLDAILGNLRSLEIDDTTAYADLGTKIVESIKATIGGTEETISTFQILAATAEKAGLMSAEDKAYLDGLPIALTGLSNSISSALAFMQSLVGYYTCDTAAGTAAKTISASGYSLTNGGCIRIKMTNANTADNVTLNINSTGAKALYYDGAQASSSNTWEAGEVLEVYYDGTLYQCASGGGGKFASGEKVKDTSITDEVTENSTALLESGAVFPMKYDMEQAESTAPLQNVSFEQGSTYNTDGTDATDSKCIRTNYLDVTGVSSITLASTLPNGYTLDMKPTWYNSSRALLQTPSWSAQSAQPITANVPSGAAYLRLVVRVYNGSTQITLTPAAATTYSFILRPFESGSRWYGLLKKCERLDEVDKYPQENSTNLVESDGLYQILYGGLDIEILGSELTPCNAIIRSSDNKWLSSSSTNNNAALIDVRPYINGEYSCSIIKGTENGFNYAFLTAGATLNTVAQFATGYSAVIHSDNDVTVSIPSNAVYLYIYLYSSSTIYTPNKVVFSTSSFNQRIERSEEAADDVEKLDDAVFSQDDNELVMSGNEIPSCGGTIVTSTGKWMANTDSYGGLINCSSFQGKKFILVKNPSNEGLGYTFTKSGFSNGLTAEYATGYNKVIYTTSDVEVIVPSDAVYVYVYLQSGSTRNFRPQYVQLGIKGLIKKVSELEQRVDNLSASNSFRIATYNIGHFSHGVQKNSTITGSDYATELAAYRQLIYGYIGADVIGLCEYSAVFGNDGTSNKDAEEVLFNRFETGFIGQQYNYSCNALYTNLFIENIAKREFECNQNAVITHTSAILATDYYYIEADLWFKGTKIKLIMTHLAFDNNNPQIAANQIAELISTFSSENKIIMMGDWNVSSFDQYAPFVIAGYTLGNNGSILTYYDTNPQKALDNIIVKGVNITGVAKVQTTGLSDHLPIYATITLP